MTDLVQKLLLRCQFDCLRSKGTITYTVDRMYNVPEVKINFNGWYKASIRLWSKSTKMKSSFLNLQRTPQPSPTFSTSSDSGFFDTVF